MILHVRVARDPDSLLPARSEIRAVDSQLPIRDSRAAQRKLMTLPRRIAATLLGACAALALLLAAVGLTASRVCRASVRARSAFA
jgi:hypothetical protein